MIAWFRKWWWVLLLAGLAILLWIASRGKQPINLASEIAAAEAQAEFKKLEATVGRDKAVREIEARYAAAVNKLEEKEKKQAEELRSNPAKRARYLARVLAGKQPG